MVHHCVSRELGLNLCMTTVEGANKEFGGFRATFFVVFDPMNVQENIFS